MHVRVASRRRAIGLSLALLASSFTVACGGQPEPGSDVSIAWTIEPAPPAANAPGVVRVTLRDAEQQVVRGASLQLEGQMSHPGMAPVLAPLTEQPDGTYQAPFQFTMAGDWVLVVSGEIAGVGRITRQIEVAGVRPAS